MGRTTAIKSALTCALLVAPMVLGGFIAPALAQQPAAPAQK